MTCEREIVLHTLGWIREDRQPFNDQKWDSHGGTGLVVTATVSAVFKFSWICDAFLAGAKANRDSWGLHSSAHLKGEKGDRGAPGPPGNIRYWI